MRPRNWVAGWFFLATMRLMDPATRAYFAKAVDIGLERMVADALAEAEGKLNG